LMMTFLPSGMAERSTSTFASARTSDEALMLVRKSVTVDLAPAAEMRPSEPTMKYEKARPESCEVALVYLEKDGICDAASRLAAEVDRVRDWYDDAGETVSGGGGEHQRAGPVDAPVEAAGAQAERARRAGRGEGADEAGRCEIRATTVALPQLARGALCPAQIR